MDRSTSSPRVAIVTGAAQGIGLSIALRLASDGLDVAINDLSSNEDQLRQVVSQIQALGRRAIAIPGDVTDEEQVQAMVHRVVEHLGGLDVMVANAGVLMSGLLVETAVQDWDRMSMVNVRGIMLCYKHAAIQMIKQGRGGRILGASSIAGKTGGALSSAYCATKFAVRGLTQSVALELAQHRITVNAYAPGIIKTTMTDGFFAASGKPLDEALQSLGPALPAELKVAEPEVIASLVSYLAKPEAFFITGQTIMINGGVVFD